MSFIRKNRDLLNKIGVFLGSLLFLWQITRAIFSLLDNNSVRLTLNHTIILSFLGFLVLDLVLVVNWKILLEGFGYKLSILEIAKGYFISFIPRYIPGSVWGYLSRSEWLFRNYKIPYLATHLSSMLEILVYLITPVFLLGEYIFVGQIIGVWSLVILIACLRLVRFILNRVKFSDLVWVKEIEPMISNLQSKDGIWVITIALFYWILSGGVMTLLGYSLFPGSIDFSKWQLITLVHSAAWVAGFLAPFIPAGIGVREVALVELFTRFIGLAQSQALIFAILARLFTLLAEAIWVILGVTVRKYY
jgi:hypothetical protein